MSAIVVAVLLTMMVTLPLAFAWGAAWQRYCDNRFRGADRHG